MDNLNPLHFGTAGLDWQERINWPRLREERLAKARAKMREHGLPAALVVEPNNMRYTTATLGIPYPGMRYALVFTDHPTILYEMGEVTFHNQVNAPWITEWRPANVWEGGCAGPDVTREEAKLFAADIKRELTELGLADEQLGVDVLDPIGQNALREAGLEITPANHVFLEARKNKTIDEIHCIRMATNIAIKGLSRICEVARIGMTENDLAAEGTAAMIRGGADALGAVCGVTSGPRCFELEHMPNTDRMIEYGDTMYVQFCNTAFSGYRTCWWRSTIVGREPTAEEQGWMKQAYDRVYGAISEIRPGATTADAARHFGVAADWGYDDPRLLHPAELGHGLGLSVHEYPFFKPAWASKHPLEFEEGMVLAIECRAGKDFVGGVRLEEVVVVTETGCEIIGKWPAEELVVVGRI